MEEIETAITDFGLLKFNAKRGENFELRNTEWELHCIKVNSLGMCGHVVWYIGTSVLEESVFYMFSLFTDDRDRRFL
jgi:hypothetical protein